MRLTAAVTVQGNWHVAQCLEVDVASQGETLEESLASLKEALELYFEDSHDAPASAPIIAPVEISIGQ
jgi:predicted RNase H-like HicB family nuclease